MNHKLPAPTDTIAAIAYYLAVALVGIIFFPVLVFTLELFLKVNGEIKWQLPVLAGALVPLVSLKCLEGKSLSAKMLAVALFICAVAKAVFVASLYYDTSADSMAYHADAILQLLQGINPAYEWMHGFDDSWVNAYPKATWIFAALVTHLTGNYNMGKCYNLLLIYAVLAYVFSFLKARGISSGTAFLMSLAVALGPVEIAQLQSFYVDGALGALVTLALFSSLAMLAKPGGVDKAVFIMASCLLINVKFTGIAYVYVLYAICACVMLWRWVKSRNAEDFNQGRILAGSMVLVTLVGVAIMGVNPYITNSISYNNPFFPLIGKGSTDVVAAQSPPFI